MLDEDTKRPVGRPPVGEKAKVKKNMNIYFDEDVWEQFKNEKNKSRRINQLLKKEYHLND